VRGVGAWREEREREGRVESMRFTQRYGEGEGEGGGEIE
jgi:hypothetical protein